MMPCLVTLTDLHVVRVCQHQLSFLFILELWWMVTGICNASSMSLVS